MTSYKAKPDSLLTANSGSRDIHYDLVTFLSIVQQFHIDYLPVTWNALEALGKGATANVHESVANITTNFAFKRTFRLFELGAEIAFKALTSEAIILATVEIRNHPNIVNLEGICWEIDDNEDITPVLVFLKAQHGDLAKFLKSVDIVHGDIKPQNVLVYQNDDGSVTAKMTDFGYSCLGSSENNIVVPPESPPWNAPEIKFNERLPLRDAKKTDVYSFGMVCLYTLFYDRLEDNNPTSPDCGKGLKKIWLGITNELLIATHDLSDSRNDTLLHFFQSTLTEDPDLRSANFEDLVKYLEIPAPRESVSHLPIQPFNISLDVLRHADYHLAEDVLALSDLDYRVRVGISKSIKARASGDQDKSQPGCQCRSKAAFQLAFCYKLGFGVSADHVQATLWLELAGGSPDDLERDVKIIRNKKDIGFQSGIIQHLNSRSTLNSLDLPTEYLKRNSLQLIERVYRKEISDMEESLGRLHPVTLRIKVLLHEILHQRGEWQRAEVMGKELLHITNKELGEEHPNTLTSMGNLALTYRNQGRWKEAEDLFSEVMERIKRVLGEEHQNTLISMNNLASTYRNQGRWKEAEELELRVMETNKRILGEEHPNTLVSMGNLALTYRNQGQWKEAEELELRVMETNKRVLGEEHPKTLTSMNNFASTYWKHGRWKEAEELELQVMETNKRVLGEEHPTTLISMNNLASTYRNQGRWKEAEELELRVMETNKRVLGEEHPNTLVSMGNLALTYRNQGQWKEAEELELRVMETNKRVLGEEHQNTLTSMGNLASTLANQGRLKEAEELFSVVMETRKRVLGEEHPVTLTSMNNLRVMETIKNLLGEEHE